MLAIPGYQILTKISESNSSLVYRGRRTQDDRPVILKVLWENYPTPAQLARYKQEYEIARYLNLEGVAKTYSLEQYQNSLVIVVEDFGGESLKILLSSRKFTLLEFFQIAIQTADILGQIHQHNIIHKDINPSNIVFAPQTGQVKIIDFGISTILSRENPTIRNPSLIEGTLAYISPEQTGRMNRAIDYRTDFYSLGATFYELLTQQLPFYTLDAVELVHCHIAKQPTPPHELNSNIPQPVSQIVMKLLAKTAENRYQSAWGIKADLETCLAHYQARGEIPLFTLGRQDISDKFQIPEKLYGRDSEVQTLLSTFERVSQGNSELMLIAGYSGIGKSALVQEIYKPITQKRGYFIRGKFDQFQRNTPYSALIQAFQDLIRQLLTENEVKLTQWREKLLTALGPNGQIIIDVIPEVELIIGEQQTVPTLAPTEAQNRFNLVFQNFVRVFTQPEHPLAIFLDDLQWADSATLKLMSRVILDPETQFLFFIGAYRNNEVGEAHPLVLTLEDLQKSGASVNAIALSPLGLETINQILTETLHTALEQTASLAKIVFIKTQGNPFFVNQFLRLLYEQEALKFDLKQKKWVWNVRKIQAMDITDNVVELMVGKIQKLAKNTQKTLQLAACIGSQFDLNTLSLICETSLEQTAADLWLAVTEGLVIPLDTKRQWTFNSEQTEANSTLPFAYTISPLYNFLHDRVQQAAYSLIEGDRKQATHLKIGRFLLESCGDEELEEKIFDLVNHLNQGIDLIAEYSEKENLARLNQIAGKKAKDATAYEPAVDYLRTGLSLLTPQSWEQQYQLTLSLHIEAAEAEYLNTNFDRSEQLADLVLQQAQNIYDKIAIFELKIRFYMALFQPLKSIETGLAALEVLGISLVSFPPPDGVFPQVPEVDDLPEMTDRDRLLAVQILSSIVTAASNAKPELYPQIVLTLIQLCTTGGHSPLAALAYCQYGVLLYILGDVNSGYRACQLSLKLLERFEAKQLKANLYNLFNYIRYRTDGLRETRVPFLEAFKSGMETGDIEHASYSLMNYCTYLFLMGEPLEIVAQQQEKYLKTLLNLKQGIAISVLEIGHQLTLNLLGKSEDCHQLVGTSFNEVEMLPQFQAAKNPLMLFCVYYAKIFLFYLSKDYQAAIDCAKTAVENMAPVISWMPATIVNFYMSLALLGHYFEVDAEQQQQYLAQVETHQQQLQLWAAQSACNYQHKYELVEAEKARILDNKWEAMEYYDRAIKGAREQGYLQEEAIAYERAAEFYFTLGREEIGQSYLMKAHYCYVRWGAVTKVEELNQSYPQLISWKTGTETRGQKSITSSLTTSSSANQTLDLATVMKASQTISSEIELSKLLAQLMKILIENAGAEKGILILQDKHRLLIEAEGTVESDRVQVLQSIPIYRSQSLSSAIVNYVARTKESVVLNDATREGNFTNDPYIKERKPKSVLCFPLIKQGKLVSLVYLENNLTTGAFTPERLEILRLLSAQAAISIDLAKLYTELRESESRLTQFLEAMPVGVFALDETGKSYYANRRAQQILGQGIIANTTPEQLAELYQVYLAGTDCIYPTERLPMVRALQGESITVDDVETRQGDKVTPIEVWGTPIFDESGKVKYAIAAFQDITERKRAEAERERFTLELFQLNQAYSRFVPRQFLQFLQKESIVDVQLGDQVQQEMSVLFSDIRSFTTLSESMTPEENFRFINAFLGRMEPAIAEHQGFIDKYIGDAIMALFSGSSDDALKAGISMLRRLEEYNQHRLRAGYVPIQIGIGINTGTLMLGTVGGHARMDGTVISDAVNLASRIEGLTKNYGISLLISHHTFERLDNPNDYAIRLIDRVFVKGKSQIVSVFEVFDADPDEVKEAKIVTRIAFEEALLLYNCQKFAQAQQRFQECLSRNPFDKVAQIYLDRCQQYG